MRILHIVTAWQRHQGDVITPWLVDLCRLQGQRGHQVEVLAPAYAGLNDGMTGRTAVHRFRYAPARWERLTHEETTPDRLRNQPGYSALVPSYIIAGAVAASRLARQHSYDVVHVHWAIPHGLFGWAAMRGSNRRPALVTTFYGAEIRWTEKRFPPGRTFLRWYCHRSHLVAISRSTQRSLEPYTESPIDVIPYGVTIPEDETREVESEVPTLLFVGRLVARKGVDRLLDALDALGNRSWQAEIVGFGPERERLEQQAAELDLTDRVTFLGRVSDQELSAAYRRATGFVLPATLDEKGDTEGLGVVLLEAMSHGVPVIATRRGGIPDIVVDGEVGLLVDDEVPALASGLKAILDDPAEARQMGQRARQRVVKSFSWDAILDRLDQVYQRGPVGKEA